MQFPKIHRMVYEGYSVVTGWGSFYANAERARARGQLVVVYRDNYPYLLGIPDAFKKEGRVGTLTWRDSSGRHYKSLSFLMNVMNGRRLEPEREAALWRALDAWLGTDGPGPRPCEPPKAPKAAPTVTSTPAPAFNPNLSLF